MKRVMILCAACLAWAGVAGAVTDTQDGNSTRSVQQARLAGGLVRADSTMKALTMSSTGGMAQYDEDRDRDKVTLWQSMISGASMVAANGDSSGVIDVHAYRYLKLLIKVTPIGAAANTTVRLAFQFREMMNGNSDSSSVFPEYQYGKSDLGGPDGGPITVAGVVAAATNTNLHTPAAAASLGLFSSVPVGAAVTGPGIAIGTYVTAKGTGDSTITISNPVTQLIGSSTISFWTPLSYAQTDSTMAGHIVTGGVSTPWSGEYVITINMNRSAPVSGVAAGIFSYPNGVSIPLDSFFGRPARFSKLQVRMRNLNITGPAVKYEVSMLGFAQ